MPKLKNHGKFSRQRTGYDFYNLLRWIDEPKDRYGCNHRLLRHAYNTEHERYIRGKWGMKAVIEWLFHIALDNLEKAHRKAYSCYKQPFKKLQSI